MRANERQNDVIPEDCLDNTLGIPQNVISGRYAPFESCLENLVTLSHVQVLIKDIHFSFTFP